MQEFNHDFFKNDPVFYQLYQIIKRNHMETRHTDKSTKKQEH